jgi:hypothetical protein
MTVRPAAFSALARLETAIVADSLICATFNETASSKVDTTLRMRVC